MVSCFQTTDMREHDAKSKNAEASLHNLPTVVYARSAPTRKAEDLRKVWVSRRTASQAMPQLEPQKPGLFQGHLFEWKAVPHQGPPWSIAGETASGHSEKPHQSGTAERCHHPDHRKRADHYIGIHRRADHPIEVFRYSAPINRQGDFKRH